MIRRYERNFSLAFEVVLSHEGGYVNNPFDRGGETKFGISKRNYPKIDIKSLSIEDAKVIYHTDYCETQRYKEIRYKKLAIKLFDLSVNMWTSSANHLVQQALQSVGIQVKEDGIVGSKSIAAINSAKPRELLAALKSEAAGYYRKIASSDRK